jgi:hypothetical protein
MGCDIHGTIERKVNNRWIMVERLSGEARERNYLRFAALAGVRGDGPAAKGIPEGVSESTMLNIDDLGSDGHSHSYMSIAEASQIFLKTVGGFVKTSDYLVEYPASYFFDVSSDEENHRLVFWFDN